ncbi:MAG: hypothetical protein CEN89_135 [Candidatus Berkelbacteria bacterium Licking1014_7]|uniref:CMP/dCMP-type deaminase domain-containing protein n=1 Tax=Candidatus Berkelbacteria bacterium Licking1014_7 TaxID=2017147 RepID=A0A554LKG6_9BACT|nr:MAG: hypothetical protein CEN89_135 [Candidatus Berkelbacteria bacterium Licking1014_7]
MKQKKYIRQRPDWDQYFAQITKVVATRANCTGHKCGAILVKDKMIISTGYNGTPKGVKNCLEGGCPRCSDPNRKSGENLDKCICVHAEENAIIQAAYHGVSSQNAVLYTTYCPCIFCAKSIINAGVKEVVYFDDYYKMDHLSNEMFKQTGIKIRKLKSL